MVRILHDDWSINVRENTSEHTLKHLEAILDNAKSKVTVDFSIRYHFT